MCMWIHYALIWGIDPIILLNLEIMAFNLSQSLQASLVRLIADL